MRLYALYDKISKDFGPLFEAKSNEVAVRSVVGNMPKVYKDFQNDFQLFFMGIYDKETGMIDSPSVKEEVLLG